MRNRGAKTRWNKKKTKNKMGNLKPSLSVIIKKLPSNDRCYKKMETALSSKHHPKESWGAILIGGKVHLT